MSLKMLGASLGRLVALRRLLVVALSLLAAA